MPTHWFVTDAAPGIDRGIVTTPTHFGDNIS
jgi:hypothetical protein